MQQNRKLITLLRSEKPAFALTIGLGALGGISAVVFAWLMSRTINEVFVEGDGVGDVAALLGGMFIVAGIRALAHWGSEATAGGLALRLKSRLRMQLLEHLFALGPAFTRGERGEQDVRTGELTNSLTEGVEALDAYFSKYLPQIALAALIPLSMLIFIFPLEPLSGFILLLTAPLIPLFMILIGSNAEARTQRQWLSVSRMSAFLLDMLQGLTTLKLLGRSKAQIESIRQVSERLRGTTMDVLRVTFLSALALEMVTTISTAVVAVQVGLRLLYGHLGFEEAFFVLLLAPEFYLPLRMLGTRFHAGMSGIAAARRIFEILEVTPTNQQIERTSVQNERQQGSLVVPRIPLEIRKIRFARDDRQDRSHVHAQDLKLDQDGDILFKDVSVNYGDGRVALDGVSFAIKAGSKTALVGESGAGKSTIAGLLLRLIKPKSGEISVDGVSLRRMPAEDWRENIAWVSQDSYLFNDSVEANIRLGHPEASREEVEQAARMANAHDFILGLPQGYDTRIGERGARLSAGQAQRIALARAFLKDAPILILDEPSAHLDPETELVIQVAMERLIKGRTTVVIAHRLNTVFNSDQIILLNEGRVEDSGTHSDLLARSEIYQRLVHQHQVETQSAVRVGEANVSPIELGTAEATADAGAWNAIFIREMSPIRRLRSVSILRRLASFLAPYRWRVGLSILLGWATISSGIGLMATSAFIIAKAALRPPIAELQVAIVGVRFFGISRGLFRYVERVVSHDLTLRILANLRVWLYKAIEPLAPARLIAHRSGDLLKRMTGDISALDNFFVRGIAPPLVAMLVTMSSALLLSRFDLRLAVLLLLALTAVGAGLPWIVQHLSRRAGRDVVQAQGEMSAAIVDGLQGMAELVSFGAAGRFRVQVEAIQRRLTQAQIRLGYIGAAQVATLGLLGQLTTLSILTVAIDLVEAGSMEGLYLGVIALVVLTSFEALQPLPQAALVLESNLEAAGRLFAIADTPPAVREPMTPRQLTERWDIKVSKLSFRYPSEGDVLGGEVLNHVSFELPHGKHMAVVGPSGAGKSTLVRLLARLWDYQTGSILLNGHELSEYSGDELRMRLAIVPQNPYLFTATILDNIRIARSEAEMDEIIKAARLAQLHDFIEGLPQGYQTWVGEHGLRLSAGERQRVAVARAVLKESPLLVLDEATANLDVLTARAMLASIREARLGRSLLVITHRLVGMEGFDEILMLDGGRVVEHGRHTELLTMGGHYSRLWEVQHRVP